MCILRNLSLYLSSSGFKISLMCVSCGGNFVLRVAELSEGNPKRNVAYSAAFIRKKIKKIKNHVHPKPLSHQDARMCDFFYQSCDIFQQMLKTVAIIVEMKLVYTNAGK